MALAMNPRSGTSTAWNLPGLAAWHRDRCLYIAVVVVTAGAAFVIGREGSLPWQMFRVAVIAGPSWLVCLTIDRGARGQRALGEQGYDVRL
jgi:hypothetical protein